MTDQPSVTSTVHSKETTFFVVLDVTGAPHTPKPYTQQVINPHRVRLEWNCTTEGRDEKLSVEIYGPRVLKDGSDGQQLDARFWRDVPAWIAELAAQYRGQVLR
jgi:hypothetical protein